MQNKIVTVSNISCGHCVNTVQNEVSELEGVISVKAEEATQKVNIAWEAPQTWAGIAALLDEIGYPATE